MSALEAAAARLKTALDDLERTVASRKADGDGAGAKRAALRRERDGLLERIVELEAERQSLAQTNEDIGARLDSAIEEVRTALAR